MYSAMTRLKKDFKGFHVCILASNSENFRPILFMNFIKYSMCKFNNILKRRVVNIYMVEDQVFVEKYHAHNSCKLPQLCITVSV